jgi:hypothetical protein
MYIVLYTYMKHIYMCVNISQSLHVNASLYTRPARLLICVHRESSCAICAFIHAPSACSLADLRLAVYTYSGRSFVTYVHLRNCVINLRVQRACVRRLRLHVYTYSVRSFVTYFHFNFLVGRSPLRYGISQLRALGPGARW